MFPFNAHTVAWRSVEPSSFCKKRELSSKEGNHISFLLEIEQTNSTGIHWGLLLFVCVCSIMSNSCDLVDCSLPGSSVHGIFQAKILELVAISYSRRSSQPRNWTQVSCIGRWILYHWAPRDAPRHDYLCYSFGALGSIAFYLADSILVSFGDQLSPIGCSLRLGIYFSQTALLYAGWETDIQFKLTLFIDQNLNLSGVEWRWEKTQGSCSL